MAGLFVGGLQEGANLLKTEAETEHVRGLTQSQAVQREAALMELGQQRDQAALQRKWAELSQQRQAAPTEQQDPAQTLLRQGYDYATFLQQNGRPVAAMEALKKVSEAEHVQSQTQTQRVTQQTKQLDQMKEIASKTGSLAAALPDSPEGLAQLNVMLEMQYKRPSPLNGVNWQPGLLPKLAQSSITAADQMRIAQTQARDADMKRVHNATIAKLAVQDRVLQARTDLLKEQIIKVRKEGGGSTKPLNELQQAQKKLAEERLRASQMKTAGAGPQNPAPPPASADVAEAGKWYNTPTGIRQWDGSGFGSVWTGQGSPTTEIPADALEYE